MAALAWLEGELARAYEGRAEHPLLSGSKRPCATAAAPRALPAADRGQPRGPAGEPLRVLAGAAGLLRAVGQPRRSARARNVRPRDAGPRGALGLGLHRAAADRALARRGGGPGPRADLPARGGPAALRLLEEMLRAPSAPPRCARCSPSRSPVPAPCSPRDAPARDARGPTPDRRRRHSSAAVAPPSTRSNGRGGTCLPGPRRRSPRVGLAILRALAGAGGRREGSRGPAEGSWSSA